MKYRTLAGAASIVGLISAFTYASLSGGGSDIEAAKDVKAVQPGHYDNTSNELAILDDNPGQGQSAAPNTPNGKPFNVLAFYNASFDQAHIDFDHEANSWFARMATENGFTYTATKNWNKLNSGELAKYQVVMFLDDYPHVNAQESAFQKYMDGGGGFIGFHVSAYNNNTSDWPWYHNDFLGTGTFRANSWGPTQEALKIEDTKHPATTGLPSRIKSSVSEWYSWNQDLRNNPNIDILASMDQSTFPIGTDPNQTWRNGYYPIVWANRKYKMVYNNFGHNSMNYASNTRLSSTFSSEQQNRLLLQEIRWAADHSESVSPPAGTPSPHPSSPTDHPATSAGTIHGYGSKCVDVSRASTADGAAVQLYHCNGTRAQNWEASNAGTLTALGKCMDVAGAGTVNGTRVQLHECNGTGSQVWRPGTNGSLVNPQSGKCLDATDWGKSDGTPLQIWSCTRASNQSWYMTS
ncbi:ThuA domain-containing protein [Streptomyces sp. Lzd4kr]|nr:ThuA domain-containing protein [Streptomyces sp. Lzd4kr]